MAIYGKACTEIISACGLMTLHTTDYSVCWKTLILVTTIEIKICEKWTYEQPQLKHKAL